MSKVAVVVIALVLWGFGLLVVIAVLVGIEDVVRAPQRRVRALERRQRWDARQLLAEHRWADEDPEREE